MRTLRSRFNLVLSLVLVIATLLPILAIYLLSESGLVEATYITQARDPRQDDQPLLSLINEWPLRLPVNDPETGQPRLNLIFDPVTGQWLGVATRDVERIVVSSPAFRFRVDLPAWIVIGSLPLFGLLLGFLVSMIMSRSVTQPISQLAQAVKAIGKRNLGYRVEARGSQELVDLAASFNRMAEELERADATRRNLMADVAHELRTPLTVLQGNLRAILDGVHALNQEEIAVLFEQTSHLHRMVDDLSELSLAEARQLPLHCQAVDLAQLVQETGSHFEPIALERGIQLTIQSASPLVHPNLDPRRISQVLHNLLSNAFRYTPQGGEIHISAQRLPEEDAFSITVSDSGAGIPAEDLPKIFDRFYRAGEGASRDRGGTGLGLAIVKAIVEMHHGKVDASSQGIGQGATFTILLPVISS